MFRSSKSYPTHPLDIPEGSVKRRGYRHHVSATEEWNYDNNEKNRSFGLRQTFPPTPIYSFVTKCRIFDSS
nr:hypothetical transcript [Hymenolepis microstoma]